MVAAGFCYYRVCVGIVALLALQVQKGQGYSVKCYSCSSKTNEACVEPDTNEYAPVVCGNDMLQQMRNNARNISKDYEKIFDVDTTHHGVEMICLKVEVLDGNKLYVLRGCQLGLDSHLDICKKMEETDTKMIRKVHCSKCHTDACNSSKGLFSISTALTLLCLALVRLSLA